jgi:hypothetical protein
VPVKDEQWRDVMLYHNHGSCSADCLNKEKV